MLTNLLKKQQDSNLYQEPTPVSLGETQGSNISFSELLQMQCSANLVR